MRKGVRKVEAGYYILAGCIILRRANGWSVHSETTGELYAEADTKKKPFGGSWISRGWTKPSTIGTNFFQLICINTCTTTRYLILYVCRESKLNKGGVR